MPPALPPSLVHSLLSAQDAMLDQLLTLIVEERDLLVRPELEANTVLAARKRDCLTKLETLTRRLREVSGRSDELGLDDLLPHAHAGEAPVLPPLWKSVKNKLERCRTLNLANGRAINLANRALERNLRLLKGQSADMELYSADGRTQSLNAYRRFQSV